MIIRKISVALLVLNYFLHFVKAVIYLPFEFQAFGKGGNDRYEIFRSLYENQSLNILNSIIDIFWPIGLLSMITFLSTFFLEKNEKAFTVTNSNPSMNDENNSSLIDQSSVGLNILSFLIPLVGLIIYLTERDRSPRKANSAGKAALWGVSVTFILSMISFIVAFALISSVNR